MSDRNGHEHDDFTAGDERAAHGERWNAELAAYALDALDPPEKGRSKSTSPVAMRAASGCAG